MEHLSAVSALAAAPTLTHHVHQHKAPGVGQKFSDRLLKSGRAANAGWCVCFYELFSAAHQEGISTIITAIVRSRMIFRRLETYIIYR